MVVMVLSCQCPRIRLTEVQHTMDWQYDPEDNTYTLTQDAARCRVWYTKLDTWAASMSYGGISSAAYNFDSAAAAQAWCAAEMAGTTRRA